MGYRKSKVSLFKLVKRVIDIVVSLSMLLVLFPVLLLAILAILALEGYPVFYISKRHVTVDRLIPIIKFRTMVRDAQSPKYNLNARFMNDGYLDIPVNCEVYTGVGRLLEKSQLVELLQLFNVLFHGMSLMGNRPLPTENLILLQKFPGWQERFSSPAGMTGISQVVGKFNLRPSERVEIEKMYSEVYNQGNVLKCDFEIAFFTLRLIIMGKHVSFEYARRLMEKCM